MMIHYGYARVSTEDQTLDAQIEALNAAGCNEIFQERIGGAKANRPEFSRLMTKIGKGDLLTVARLDRIARSTRELLNILGALAERGAQFRSLADPWADTTTPRGRAMLTVLGGLAEFERELLRSRTGEGRERARARGQRIGRPPRLTAHQRAEAFKALHEGSATQADLARRFAVSQSTISRLADKAAPSGPSPALDPQTERAARAFMKQLEGRYPVIEGLLFGSRARGTHRGDSDADLAVILKGKAGSRYKVAGDMAGVAFDVMQETGVLVDPLPLWEEELARPELFSNPALIESIKREGRRL